MAILSRFPQANAVEFDRGTDGNSRPGYPTERKLERVDLDGIADVGVGAAFSQPTCLNCVVAVMTHLKSSGGRSGDSDRDNARKREIVAAAMARHVAAGLDGNSDLSENPRRSP